MPSAKRSSTHLNPFRATRKELQTLYARRCAIDALIESLKVYERYSVKSLNLQKRKLA